jgi:hypothetical protein
VGQRWRLCLAPRSPPRGGCSEQCDESSGKEDKQSQQDAQIQKSGLRSVICFHRQSYGRGGRVGRGLAGGVPLGVSVGLGVDVAVGVAVAVAVAVGVGVGVNVAVAVAVAAAVGVGVGEAVEVGVGDGVVPAWTSNEPLSMRLLRTRQKPGPR